MAPNQKKDTADTDYDYEIPGVVVDTNPKAKNLKAAFQFQMNKLLAEKLVSTEQIAAVIASADTIKQLGIPQSDIIKDLIAQELLDVCEQYGDMDFEIADRAYDDFRTNYLLSINPRVPKFPTPNRESGIRARCETIRLQLFKTLP